VSACKKPLFSLQENVRVTSKEMCSFFARKYASDLQVSLQKKSAGDLQVEWAESLHLFRLNSAQKSPAGAYQRQTGPSR
jgi:hypothetical protein